MPKSLLSRIGRGSSSAAAAALAALLLGALAASPAEATMVISGQATKNVSCKHGICKATRHFAILNAGDLTGMLAAGDVTVLPGIRAEDVELKVPLSWASASRLTLDAYRSILIDRTLTVTGSGALTMTTNDGGSGGDFFFNGKGRAIFWDLASSLIVNGTTYTLVGDIATLASDIAAHPTGSFALANNYDASVDGTYASSPVAVTFAGRFEGLGNTISHLTIQTPSNSTDSYVGLFSYIDKKGTIDDVRLTTASVTTLGDKPASIGILVGYLFGLAAGDKVAGHLQAHAGDAGGLAGDMPGVITRSSANVRITGTATNAGGLAGQVPGSNFGLIQLSHADGDVSGAKYAGGLVGYTSWFGAGALLDRDFATGSVSGFTAGGLVAVSEGRAQNSYATGAVSGAGDVGGFVGSNDFYILDLNYAIGHVQVSPGGLAGGFAGCDVYKPSHDYWDTDTAGVTVGNGGANGTCTDTDTTIGLTTAQFQSGLPNGFDPTIWAEDPAINNGFPYLIANPPQ
jgi:hypothetical protein